MTLSVWHSGINGQIYLWSEESVNILVHQVGNIGLENAPVLECGIQALFQQPHCYSKTSNSASASPCLFCIFQGSLSSLASCPVSLKPLFHLLCPLLFCLFVCFRQIGKSWLCVGGVALVLLILVPIIFSPWPQVVKLHPRTKPNNIYKNSKICITQ